MAAQDISNGRPLTGNCFSMVAPDWIAEGALAAWPMQDLGAYFEDAGNELWDIPRPTSQVRSNLIYREKLA